MTDIVERLQAQATGSILPEHPLMHDAAIEIMRLRTWIAIHRGDVFSLNNEVELMRSHWLDAEERLRSAGKEASDARANVHDRDSSWMET